MFAWRLGAIICGWPLLAAIYYPGLTDLAQGPHGRKSPNRHFVAPAKEGGGVLKTPTPLASCLLHVACLAPSYLLPARMYNYNLLRANKQPIRNPGAAGRSSIIITDKRIDD